MRALSHSLRWAGETTAHLRRHAGRGAVIRLAAQVAGVLALAATRLPSIAVSSETILLVIISLLAVLLVWIASTVSRLDRLDERVGAARSALDAQLVRRAAVAQAIADERPELLGQRAAELRHAAHGALNADDADREEAENTLGHLLRGIGPEVGGLPNTLVLDLRSTTERVVLARRFYNDAVRDNRQLRGQGLSRLFRLAARRPLPAHFDIDDRPAKVADTPPVS